jgi:hypothetical protein
VDSIELNFGPDSKPLEPTKSLPIQAVYSNPYTGPSLSIDSILIDIHISQIPMEPTETIIVKPTARTQHPPTDSHNSNSLILDSPQHLRKRKSTSITLGSSSPNPKSLSSIHDSSSKKKKFLVEISTLDTPYHGELKFEESRAFPFSIPGTFVTSIQEHTLNSSTSDFGFQNFLMAEEAGLIKPLLSP